MSWLILKRGLLEVAIELPLGLGCALALGVVVLERMLVEMSPGDPLTFAASTIVLAVVSFAACLLLSIELHG